MYIVVVYDVSVEKVNKIRTLLRQYLFWVQNSVFEGNITNSKYYELINLLKKEIDNERDSLIIYKIRSEKEVKRDVFGDVKGIFPEENIL